MAVGVQITEHFKRSEFDCHDGTPVPDELMPNLQRLCRNLEALRKRVGKPIRILSGYRTKEYNDSRPGTAQNSKHLKAAAADITIRDMTPRQIRKEILGCVVRGEMEDGGIGLYDGFLHYDVRGYAARWDNRTNAEA